MGAVGADPNWSGVGACSEGCGAEQWGGGVGACAGAGFGGGAVGAGCDWGGQAYDPSCGANSWQAGGWGKGQKGGNGKGCSKGGGYGGGFGAQFGKGGAKGKGKAEWKIANGEQCFIGTLRCYNVEKQYGYIASNEVYSQCGTEVYAFSKVLQQAGTGVGDLLCFFLHWSAKGQAQCSSPVLRLSNPNQYVLKGTFKPTEQGYGFIQCQQTREYFGRDVYVHRDMVGCLQHGQFVSFNIRVTPEWQPSCAAIEACDASWEPYPGDLSSSTETAVVDAGPPVSGGASCAAGGVAAGGIGPGCGSMGCGNMGCGAMACGSMGCGGMGCTGMSRKRPATQTGETMQGVLKSYNATNSWGFIECEGAKARWGKDVWVAGENLPPHLRQVGASFQFEIALNEKGQPQATNIVDINGACCGGGGWGFGGCGEVAGGCDGSGACGGFDPNYAATVNAFGSENPAAKKQKTDGGPIGDDVAAAISALGFSPETFNPPTATVPSWS